MIARSSSVPATANVRSWTRRDFLRVAAATGLLCASPRLFSARPEDRVTVSILHTTDLHGHILPTRDYLGTENLGGLARCVTQIRRWRKENPNAVVIDVGDLYQGTEAGLRTKGRIMTEMLNLAGFDAWVVGNHEFDWGIDPFWNALEHSRMPVLGANMSRAGEIAGAARDGRHPFARIAPFLLREFEGIKVAIIGVTTPGMPFWFRPEYLGGLSFAYPVEPVRRAVRAASAAGANAIVLAAHMGLKDRTGGDDFANTLMALTAEFPEIAVVIAGHTHRLVESRLTGTALLTQADHFGIHAGRVDLVFDRASKKLVGRSARCALMDRRIRPDPIILARARPHLRAAQRVLRQRVGRLRAPLGRRSEPGFPSGFELLIAAAVREALASRGTPVDGVLHGTFGEKTIAPGPVTVADIWEMVPFENHVVTANLSGREIRAVLDEVFQVRETRNLMGFGMNIEGSGRERRVRALRKANGEPAGDDERFTIAMNSFDSRSAGHRFMILRDLLERNAARPVLHPVQTREALIAYFERHEVVDPALLSGDLPAAA